jgi:hypothetical protein
MGGYIERRKFAKAKAEALNVVVNVACGIMW